MNIEKMKFKPVTKAVVFGYLWIQLIDFGIWILREFFGKFILIIGFLLLLNYFEIIDLFPLGEFVDRVRLGLKSMRF